jgi:hypothetical protein
MTDDLSCTPNKLVKGLLHVIDGVRTVEFMDFVTGDLLSSVLYRLTSTGDELEGDYEGRWYGLGMRLSIADTDFRVQREFQAYNSDQTKLTLRRVVS